jgi:hypothetical protein
MGETEEPMDEELIYDEDRLTGEPLTPDEIEALRAWARKNVAFARRYYRFKRYCEEQGRSR